MGRRTQSWHTLVIEARSYPILYTALPDCADIEEERAAVEGLEDRSMKMMLKVWVYSSEEVFRFKPKT